MVASETTKEETKPDTEMGSAPMKDAKPAEPAAEKPAEAADKPAEDAKPAANDDSAAMDTSNDKSSKKRKASEIENDAPATENGAAEPAKEAAAVEPAKEKEAETPKDASDAVATKKAKTLNGEATPTKVVPGDEAKAATDAMPKQAPVA